MIVEFYLNERNNVIAGLALVVVPMVPWNHSIFEKGAMKPIDF